MFMVSHAQICITFQLKESGNKLFFLDDTLILYLNLKLCHYKALYVIRYATYISLDYIIQLLPSHFGLENMNNCCFLLDFLFLSHRINFHKFIFQRGFHTRIWAWFFLNLIFFYFII